ncbi:efflux RND transporter periplasmic adaptor subunit [Nonlabens sp. Asnod2-A12]|uniref:efflux RND transporter periplasmic adaptor subunit n=1 Tax=Nonlabens sp. Asnod2-A12 TaxID=3160578 RepID=UPI00386F2E15
MKKIIPFIVMALLVVSCQHKEEKHKSIPTLRVTNLILKDTTITRKYVSQIHAMRHIELRALERGYLQKIYVDEGQKVEKGQTMFAINANVYKAELQKSKSEARAAEIEYDNTKMLSDKNVVSKNELALAEARLAKANAEVRMAQTHLNFTTIHAPFTGIMDHLEAREGSLLEEGELLTKISDNSKMWVYFNVPESEYINYVTDTTTHASSVQLQMANSAIFNHKGKVETIEGEFNHETGNIEFRATFPNPESLLRHGQTGNILMNIPFKNAKIIPQKATFEILDKKYVFVVNDKEEVEQRQISILEELPYLYIVKDGIDSNDRILIDGLRKVRNGQKINADFIEPKTVLADLKLVAE